jgi:dCTP deaminase
MGMTVLSDLTILEYIQSGRLLIDPFSQQSLGPSGYDLRSASPLSISPGGHQLAHTLETVEVGSMVCGQLFLRSSFAREGLLGSFALVDPGFRGQLTLSLSNMGSSPIEVDEGERLAQIIFTKLDREPQKTYSGRYQNSSGAVASRRCF